MDNAGNKAKYRTQEDGLRDLMRTKGWINAEAEVAYLTDKDN